VADINVCSIILEICIDIKYLWDYNIIRKLNIRMRNNCIRNILKVVI